VTLTRPFGCGGSTRPRCQSVLATVALYGVGGYPAARITALRDTHPRSDVRMIEAIALQGRFSPSIH
jgi:hypothetical protein